MSSEDWRKAQADHKFAQRLIRNGIDATIEELREEIKVAEDQRDAALDELKNLGRAIDRFRKAWQASATPDLFPPHMASAARALESLFEKVPYENGKYILTCASCDKPFETEDRDRERCLACAAPK